MRLAIFTDSFHPSFSGVATNVIEHTSGLLRRGHQVLIVAPHLEGELPERLRGATVTSTAVSLPYPGRRDLRIGLPTFLPALRRLREFRPDIVHLYTERPVALEGLFCARRLGVPCVGHFNTLLGEAPYVRSYARVAPRAAAFAIWKHQTWFYGRCDHVVSLTRAALEILRAYGCTTPASVISSGVRPPCHVEDGRLRALRAAHGCAGGPNVIYAGRIAKEKRVCELLEVWASLATRHPGGRLVLIGNGNEVPAVRKRLQDSALARRVAMLGPRSHEEIYAGGLYRMGDVFATCSRSETECVAILEAMAHALPVVAYGGTPIDESVNHGESGLLCGSQVEFAGALGQLLSDRDLRERMGANARIAVRRKSVELSVEAIESLSRELARRR
ncbi:MAG: glycosyltransferase [Longimicrobiaceae bacterium]